MQPREAKALLDGISREVLEKSAKDGEFWLKWVNTRDEADAERSIKPFPTHLEYIRELWKIWASQQCTVVAKSRQMLVSWVAAAFCVWWARFKPNQAVYWQTQQWKDALAMIATPEGAAAGRCQFIESNLPGWMRQKVKYQEGLMTYGNGSFIQALAGGADQIRGKVASVIVQDEFAHQQEASGVYTTIAPLIQKGMKLIVISTPNGTANTFSTLYHGRNVGVQITE